MLLADGSTKKIKHVQVGDQVAATDPESGETSSRPVTKTHINLDKALTDVTVMFEDGSTEIIYTTQEHPFWDATDGEWTLASELLAGHRLLTTDGVVVSVIDVRNYAGQKEMRNLTVEEIHTYYVLVGRIPVLVHNDDACDIPTSLGSTGRTTPGGANEQRALDLVKENAQYGNRLPLTMRDPRWSAEDGWVKMEQTVDGVEIHYVYNTRTGDTDDFKFKDWSE